MIFRIVSVFVGIILSGFFFVELWVVCRFEFRVLLILQVYLFQEGNRFFDLAWRFFWSCRLEIWVGKRELVFRGRFVFFRFGFFRDRQSLSDVDIAVVLVLFFRYWECYFSWYGGDRQFCSSGFGGRDSYEEQYGFSLREVCLVFFFSLGKI